MEHYYNFFDCEHTTIQANDTLSTTKVTVKLEFDSKGMPIKRLYNHEAVVRLFVNDRFAGEAKIPKVATRHSVEPFEVGRDSISPVNEENKGKRAPIHRDDRIKYV